jgi:putative transposase
MGNRRTRCPGRIAFSRLYGSFRDFWLEPWEKEAIIGFQLKNPVEGYRRLTFMMLDAEVVAVSPASVWRVLQQAGLLSRWKGKPSRKGPEATNSD